MNMFVFQKKYPSHKNDANWLAREISDRYEKWSELKWNRAKKNETDKKGQKKGSGLRRDSNPEPLAP